MKTTYIPVIAAIPNYNMAAGLMRLLPQLLKHSYDHIYILDDCSTDNSKEVSNSFRDRVTFIENTINQGAGGARNLIMPHIKEVSLIHFMDADISLISKNNPKIIRDLGVNDKTGLVGGLVLESDGNQSIWNYGGLLSITESIRGGLMVLNNSWARFFVSKPHPGDTPVARETSWVLERNFVIRSDTFKRLGGFDATIREHDIQPLAFKTYHAGLKNRFDPRFSVASHQDIDVRPYNRFKEMIKTEFYIVRTYNSWLRWLFPFLNKKQPR